MIGRSAASLGLSDRTRVVCSPLGHKRALAAIESALPRPASLVFADPPYADVEAAASCLQSLLDAGLLAADARIVLEHAHKKPPHLPAGFAELSTYRYGDTAARLWRRADEQTFEP